MDEVLNGAGLPRIEAVAYKGQGVRETFERIWSEIMARTQWNKKQSWRFTSPNPEREREINWRLRKELSLGLVGEIGMHQIDAASWFMNMKPTVGSRAMSTGLMV